jgi:hypothetical protein
VHLDPAEDVVLRQGVHWWWVNREELRRAFDAACEERRSIDLGNPAYVDAVRLPGDARRRDDVLRRLMPC